MKAFLLLLLLPLSFCLAHYPCEVSFIQTPALKDSASEVERKYWQFVGIAKAMFDANIDRPNDPEIKNYWKENYDAAYEAHQAYSKGWEATWILAMVSFQQGHTELAKSYLKLVKILTPKDKLPEMEKWSKKYLK